MAAGFRVKGGECKTFRNFLNKSANTIILNEEALLEKNELIEKVQTAVTQMNEVKKSLLSL